MNISSTGNRVYENNITLNTICGIFVATPDCSGNRFYNNNFINNTLYMERQAYDVGGNYWDNGYSAGGNYWSDYTGTDLTGPNDVPDGIGDTPYDIAPPDVGNVDQYPLMEPKKW
jgi:parallel beta-helix repeat protein